MTFNENKEYREFRSETLRELQGLQRAWRKQDFYLTPEQQQRYEYLKSFRREQVLKFYEDGLVWIGPSTAGKPLEEVTNN